MITTVHLIRHGRTAWHDPTRYAGSSDIPLDAVGEQQARRLAKWASAQPLTSLICSDLRRARATAAPIAERTGHIAVVDQRLREPHFGIAEGKALVQVRSEAPAAAAFERDPIAHAWPGAEDPLAVAARGLAAIHAAVGRDRGGLVLMIAHSTLVRLTVCATLGITLASYRRALPRLDRTDDVQRSLRLSPQRPDQIVMIAGIPGARKAPRSPWSGPR